MIIASKPQLKLIRSGLVKQEREFQLLKNKGLYKDNSKFCHERDLSLIREMKAQIDVELKAIKLKEEVSR